MDDPVLAAADHALMARAIALSREGAAAGEYPFGAVVARNGEVVAEAVNHSVRTRDVSRHAEVLALAEARRLLGPRLADCTLYSSVEPCAMCSFCIRENGIGRVVFALGSPFMGGLSKWNVLRDRGLSDAMPQVFGAPPEVVSGFMLAEAEQAWRDWNPLYWRIIRLRGFLSEPQPHDGCLHVHAPPRRSWLGSLGSLLPIRR